MTLLERAELQKFVNKIDTLKKRQNEVLEDLKNCANTTDCRNGAVRVSVIKKFINYLCKDLMSARFEQAVFGLNIQNLKVK